MDDRDKLLKYWIDPTDENKPEKYLTKRAQQRSRYLMGIFKRHVPKSAEITELGCNVGRNLWHLWENGYFNLTGIELNPEAIKVMKSEFPKMNPIILEGRIEDHIHRLPKQDVIFTMAVLMHIHPDSDWIFPMIAERADTVIIIEDERGKGARATVRDYLRLFRDQGMKSIERHNDIPGLNGKYVGWVFKHA